MNYFVAHNRNTGRILNAIALTDEEPRPVSTDKVDYVQAADAEEYEGIKIMLQIRDGEFEEVEYGCTGTTAFTDGAGRYFNRSGQLLRDPDEFNPHSEGYTPFGDE